MPAEDFNLLGAFRALARDDFLRSVETAKGFTGEAPRATATLAVARSVLEKLPANRSRREGSKSVRGQLSVVSCQWSVG